jgi:hypothetical protein
MGREAARKRRDGSRHAPRLGENPGCRELDAPLQPDHGAVEQGADTIVWLAASSQAGESTGRFWLDREARDTHFVDKTRETETERQQLWSRLEALSAGVTP